jgi:hypothetical protein
MPKQNKSKWIYWLKEPKHPHWLDFRATGLSATEWNEKFKVSPSALIFMRNALVKKNNAKIKKLNGTYAVLKDGLQVYVEMIGAFNLSKNQRHYSKLATNVHKATIRRNAKKRLEDFNKVVPELTIEQQRLERKRAWKRKQKGVAKTVPELFPPIKRISKEERNQMLLDKYPPYVCPYTDEERAQYGRDMQEKRLKSEMERLDKFLKDESDY